MFLHHPDTLLDLALLEQAERDSHLEQHLHLVTLREIAASQPKRALPALAIRPRFAHLLRALADRLQPAPERRAHSADLWAHTGAWAAPRTVPIQRLRQHARSHAMAIARRHDAHRLDAA